MQAGGSFLEEFSLTQTEMLDPNTFSKLWKKLESLRIGNLYNTPNPFAVFFSRLAAFS